MIRMLVADDHQIVREGVKRVVENASDISVAGEAANDQEVLHRVEIEKWDVLLIDIMMPGRGALEMLHDLKKMHPRLPILVFSVYPAKQYAVRALRAGAAGYLSKDMLCEELLTAIRKVVRGGLYISPSLAEHVALEMVQDTDKPLHTYLSDREYQVMCLIGMGRTVTEIAGKLCLSVKTISTYRTRILEKMQLTTTAELIHYAVRQRLVE